MNAIVNVTSHWGIGKNGKLLVSIPTDLQRFRELTIHKTVIYGRKTIETFPGCRPLADRENIILTRNQDFTAEGAIICHNMDELKSVLRDRYSDNLWVIGGESVYKRYYRYCDTAIITKIDQKYESDAFFPNLDDDEDWTMTAESEEFTYFNVEYTFREYHNSNVYKWEK